MRAIRKKGILVVLSVVLFMLLVVAYFIQKSEQAIQVSEVKQEVKTEGTRKQNKEVLIQKPFRIHAQCVLAYFDGKPHAQDTITKFEGVYRANQGCDYAYHNEAFEVLNCYDGVVKEVKNDSLFGGSVSVDSKGVLFTYQSLKHVDVKVGQTIKQGQKIGVCGSNIYHKDLGNHLHVTIRVKDHYVNPECVFGQKIETIK